MGDPRVLNPKEMLIVDFGLSYWEQKLGPILEVGHHEGKKRLPLPRGS